MIRLAVSLAAAALAVSACEKKPQVPDSSTSSTVRSGDGMLDVHVDQQVKDGVRSAHVWVGNDWGRADLLRVTGHEGDVSVAWTGPSAVGVCAQGGEASAKPERVEVPVEGAKRSLKVTHGCPPGAG